MRRSLVRKRWREVEAEGSKYTAAQRNGEEYVWGSVRKITGVGSGGGRRWAGCLLNDLEAFFFKGSDATTVVCCCCCFLKILFIYF